MLCKIDKPLSFPFLAGCKGMGIYRYSTERVRAHTCACAYREVWIYKANICITEIISGPVCMCENEWASRSVCGSSAPVCVGVAIVCARACVARVCLVGYMWEEANYCGLRSADGVALGVLASLVSSYIAATAEPCARYPLHPQLLHTYFTHIHGHTSNCLASQCSTQVLVKT